MPVRVECPGCGKVLSAPSEYAGRKVKCGGCQETMKIPQAPLVTSNRKAKSRLPLPAIAISCAALGFVVGLAFAAASSDPDKIIALQKSLGNEEKRSNKLESELTAAVLTGKGYEKELSDLEVRPVGTKPGRREQLLETRLVTARESLSQLQGSLDAIRKKYSDPMTTGSLEAFRDLESTISTAPNWSRLAAAEKKEQGLHAYGHTSGLRAVFWEMQEGTGRLRFSWDTSDKAESEMAASMWLLIPSVGGPGNSTHRINTERIVNWIEKPTEILLLKGGVIHAQVSGVDAQIDLYCPN